MKLGSLVIDRRFLESRVARRVFATVAACAFVPIATFAAFAYHEVGRHLVSDATDAVRVASKTAGMGILERLLLADEALRQRIAVAGVVPSDAVSPTTGELSPTGRVIRSVAPLDPADGAWSGLGIRGRVHLEGGGTVLRVLRTEDDAPARFVLLRKAPDGPWMAEVDPGFLFSGERRFAGDAYWVVDAEGRPLFSTLDGAGLPAAEDPRGDEARVRRVDVAGERSLVSRWTLFLGSVFAADSWSVHVARPLDRIEAPLREFEALFPWIAGITLCCAVGLALVQIRRTLVPVSALMQGARRVAVGDFGARVGVFSRDEFGYLSEAFNEMADVIERHVDVLATVNRIGAALSAQSDTDGLLDLILRGAMQVTLADGGVLLLSDDEELEVSRVRLRHAAPVANARPERDFPLDVAQWCLRLRSAVREEERGPADDGTPDRWRDFSRHLGAPIGSWLALPMRDESDELLGVLVLVARSRSAFDEQACRLAESLASQAAVAMRKNGLVESFRGLFEGLIQLTVRAIDEKSAYTGDHCRKVPILTELIADALCRARTGPYKDFDLSPDERYELRIAALLHDCGKVVTPVHVMDKATKMETLFDRIALVATRFEVLRRDAVVRALERRAGVDARQAALEDADLARELASLEEDLAFLERCNVGSEQMPEADRDRVRAIARRYRWESARGEVRDALDEGEVTCLTIPRGTLTEDERAVVENHVVTTIDMLEELPFPKSLWRVPFIAGSHHERVDGTGYPHRLRGPQLGMQSRILGLADVFEALTARDRPYKPGRTLSETLAILDRMCEEGHLDRDLYAFFLGEKLHLRYAVEHVAPDQIDEAHWEEIERLTGP